MTAQKLLGDGVVAQGIVTLDAITGLPVTFASPKSKIRAGRLIAYNSTATITPSTTPTAVTWTTTSVVDPQWDVTAGVITFAENCMFNSVFFANLSSVAGALTVLNYYVDAEVSVDGGVTWIRGSNSLRQETVRGSDNAAVRSFPFAGGFTAGTKLRFVHWASSTSGRLTTDTNNGSTAPALRLTYNYAPCDFIT